MVICYQHFREAYSSHLHCSGEEKADGGNWLHYIWKEWVWRYWPTCSSETLVTNYQLTWWHIPKDCNLHKDMYAKSSRINHTPQWEKYACVQISPAIYGFVCVNTTSVMKDIKCYLALRMPWGKEYMWKLHVLQKRPHFTTLLT